MRNPDYKAQPSERILAWFNNLRFSGFRGTTPYELEYPWWYMNPNVERPKLSREAVELGRVLFYDKDLSADSSVACASCHKQQFAFADNVRISPGVKGRLGKRNAMPLVNLVSDRRFFWDGRVASLEEQVLMPIEDWHEMDLPLDELISRLEKHPIYPALFERAYNSRTVTRALIADALAQFVKSIISYSSPDDYMRAVDVGKLKLSEIPVKMRKYWPLYQKNVQIMNCGPCHTMASAFGQNMFEDAGLEEEAQDVGYYVVSKKAEDKGKFKVPAVRNLAVTAPYMHDGRFGTLMDVIEHYRTKIIRKANISPLYIDANNRIKTTTLTDAQVAVMLEGFSMNTDEKLLNEPRYSNPF
ncbi:MAG: cytochrome c peroxidase [Turneriella sp.]